MRPLEFVDRIFKGTPLEGIVRIDPYGRLHHGVRPLAYIASGQSTPWGCIFINDIYLIAGLLGEQYSMSDNDVVGLGDQDAAFLTASYILMKGI